MAKFIDNGIEKFAGYLRDRNNLDHITYLKVRLGMQTVMINLTKMIVTYGVSLLLGLFLYTLTVHLTFFIIRLNAHGAHAKNPLNCHILNLILFVFLPWLTLKMNLYYLMLVFAIIGIVLLFKYAPGITLKQPIPNELHRKKKIKTTLYSFLIFIISFLFPTNYQLSIFLGLSIIGGCQLPFLLPKEES